MSIATPRKPGIIRDERFLDHLTGDGHPEHPRRLAAVYDMLDTAPMTSVWQPIPFQEAGCDDLLMLHTPDYMTRIAATQGQESIALTADTVTSSGTYLASLLAVGGCFSAVRHAVEGTIPRAFALIRPPGHHAEQSRALGYCLFNNVALAAAAARHHLGLRRVLIVDWDVHHGNGTQHFFEQDDSVLFFSVHQYPHFPKTGFFTEAGIGKGEGYTINVPLPKGYGDGEYAAIFEYLLKPVALSFAPELILVSAGFDIHPKDPLGGMRVTPEGMAGLTRCLVDIAESACNGRLVFVLEGGYEPSAVAESAQAVLLEMADRTRTPLDTLLTGADPKKAGYALKRSIGVHAAYWPVLRERRSA